VLVSKADLLTVLNDFDVAKVVQGVRALGNPAPVIAISARSGAGMGAWLEWLQAQRAVLQGLADAGSATRASS
jgi:hydrogenase nickel incorporation protein HypB